MTFLHKRIGEGDTSFGSDLRDLRILQNLSVADVSRATKIDPSIIRALEEERLEDLDDPIFSAHHIKSYVRFLGGYEPYFKARYAARLRELKKERRPEDLLPKVMRLRMRDFFVGPRLIAVFGLFLFSCLLCAYVLYQAFHVNTPPMLNVDTPADGEHVSRPRVVVSGTTLPEAYVTVNGRDAPVDEQGAFSILLDVRRGTTIITITATRRRGSETVIERRVIFDRPIVDGIQPESASSTETATGTDILP